MRALLGLAIGALMALTSLMAPAEAALETRSGFFAYQGKTAFYDGLLLTPHPLSVDLGSLISKYIGETEENLDALFESAESRDVVLLFDEADALFEKRTEVKDAHDRFAQDFILLDLDSLRWYGQIYYAPLDGVYELAGTFAVPSPASLAVFVAGLAMLGVARRRS